MRFWFAVLILGGIAGLLIWARQRGESDPSATALPSPTAARVNAAEEGNQNPARGEKAKDESASFQGVGPASKSSGKKPSSKGGDPSAPAPADRGPAPWAHLLAAAGEPPPFEDVCFDDFPSSQRGLEVDALRRWLAAADGSPLRINQTRVLPVVIDGTTKLRAPWLPNTALRLAVANPTAFKIHVYAGQDAVTLQYYDRPRPSWAAYAVNRRDNNTRPQRLAFVGQDSDRYSRSGWGTFSLHYDDGQLILTRGNVRLLSVPLAAEPAEIYFDGRAAWRGITMFRCGPVPAEEEQRTLALKVEKPAKVRWFETLPRGASLERLDDGRLRLSSKRAATEARVSLPTNEPGLYELVVQVDDPTPGAGIYLGQADGQPIYRLGFFSHRPTSRIVCEALPPRGGRGAVDVDPEQQPVPLVGKEQWFRLIAGLGTFKCWTSADGRSWARLPGPPPQGLPPQGFASVGLYCLGDDQTRTLGVTETERHITLRHLELRELGGISSLASAEAREKARCFDSVADPAAWLQMVSETQPAKLAADDWRRACAIRTLAGSPPRGVAKHILLSMVREALHQRGPPETRLRLLDEAGLLWDGWKAEEVRDFDAMYDRLGELLVREGRPRVFETLVPAVARSTICSEKPLQIVPGAAVHADLLRRVGASQWPEALTLFHEHAYWHRAGAAPTSQRDNLGRWVDWAAAVAYRSRQPASALASAQRAVAAANAGQKPPEADEKPLAAGERPTFHPNWQHPLVEHISKEGFNALAEFQAALDGEAYDDVCQLITQMNLQASLGLLPDGKDRDLFVSLPRAVALAMQQQPALKQAMRDKFGGVATLRVRQAKLAGDAATIQAATVQYLGTDGAAEAHQWLGDRALAAGDAEGAIAHYALAMSAATLPLRPQLTAMLRLAHAMTGREFGQKAKETIEFGGTQLSPAEFEQLVTEQLAQRRASGLSAAASGGASAVTPPPARYELRPWGDFAGTRGQDQANPPIGIDWAGRQLNVVLSGSTMYVSDRHQVAALDVANGKLRWATTGGDNAFLHQWAGVSSRPIISGDRVFARRLLNVPPRFTAEIGCWDAANGKVLWSTRDGKSLPVEFVSDPLLVGGEVVAFVAARDPDGLIDLRLISLDPASGQVRRTSSLVRLRNAWVGEFGDARLACQAVAAEDQIIATVGGCVLSCDARGQAQWVRRQFRPPPTLPVLSQAAAFQHRTPPLVAGDRVYVTQREVAAAECLDRHTGRLVWRHAAGDLRRIAGLAESLVIVEGGSGLRALDAATGQMRWQREIAGLLEAQLCGGRGGILISQRERLADDTWRACLVWLDPKTGSDVARLPLPLLTGKEPLVGPLLSDGQRTWLFTGENVRESRRRIWELVPSGSATSPPATSGPEDAKLSYWLPEPSGPDRERLATLRGDVASALPGWTLVSSEVDPQSAWHDQRQGERDVVVTLAAPSQTVRLLRQVSVPAGGKCQLAVQVGHVPGGRWDLEITAAGKPALRFEVSEKTAPGGWLKKELDLSRFAGQTIWLAATQRSLAPEKSYANWKRLEIVTDTRK
jgi:outer membrane protein assembly factor BamB